MRTPHVPQEGWGYFPRIGPTMFMFMQPQPHWMLVLPSLANLDDDDVRDSEVVITRSQPCMRVCWTGFLHCQQRGKYIIICNLHLLVQLKFLCDMTVLCSLRNCLIVHSQSTVIHGDYRSYVLEHLDHPK